MRLVDQVSSALSFAHRNGVIHGALSVDNVVLDADSNAYIVEFGLIDVAGSEPARNQSPALDVHDLASLASTALTGTAATRGPRISDTRPDLVGLDHVFQRALHADPGSRFRKPEDFRRALRQVAGGDVVSPSPDIRVDVERRNPYKGLRAFHESDAADFHGRDALIAELVETVAAARLVTVVGPSGSGKSSLVRAGLIPALRSDGISGSRTWPVTEMFPGTHPFEELEAALVRVAMDRPPGFFEDLTLDERGLARAAKQILGSDDDELLLIVDQFEELFSLVASETIRTQFLAALVAAATDERSGVRIVLTLRADFFDQPLRYSEFAEVMRLDVVPVGPPTEDGLARAIAQPARDVGVDLEPGLLTRIVEDVKHEPGGMPLMQYALTELFSAREHNTLTLDAYHRTGGVLGALGRRAEEIYQDLSDDGKEATRQLFLRLVTVDELADDTRRRVRQTELRSLGINPVLLDDVLQQFGSYRLLSFDRDAATRTPTVEVAHEALIREWERLRTWVDERREDLLIHRRIQVAVRDWEDSGKDPSDLLRGSRLDQALVWQERTDIVISDDEMTFIEAGIETEKQEEAERLALEEKAARRRKAVIGVLAGGLVVAGVLGTLALDRARDASITAAEATARDIAAASLDAVVEDPELAVLLALESFEPTNRLGLDPMPEAISALRTTLPQQRVIGRLSEGQNVLEVSPDGETIATDRKTGDVPSVAFMDSETGQVLRLLDLPEGGPKELRDLVYSPSGEQLAVVRASSFLLEASADSAVDLFQVATGRHLMTASPDTEGAFHTVSFGSDGLLAVNGGDPLFEGSVQVFDTGDGSTVMTQSAPGLTARFLPGTEVLVVGQAADASDSDVMAAEQVMGTIQAVDVHTEEVLWSFETEIQPQTFALSTDGALLAVADPYGSRTVQVLSLPDGEMLFDLQHRDPQGLAWSRDDTMLAIFGNDGDITVLDVPSGERSILLTGHQAGVTSVAFFPNGSRLASVALDGDPRVWTLGEDTGGQRAPLELDGVPISYSMSPDEGRLFVLMLGTDSGVVDLATRAIGPTFPIAYRNPLKGVVDLSFTRLAGTDHNDNGHLFDLASGEKIRTLDPPCLAPHALSPDASLLLVDATLVCKPEPGEPGEPSRVMETETGEMVIDLGRRALAFGVFGRTAQGREYVVVHFWDTVEVLAIDNGEVLGTLRAGDVGGNVFLVLSLDSTNRYLGIGTNGPRALVVDMEAVLAGTPMFEALLLDIEAHKGNTPLVNVTSDGVAISSSLDGFYRAWDLDTDQKLWEIRVTGLEGPPGQSFDRDETELIYKDGDGVVRFTPLDTDEVVAQARVALTRGLTDDECRQYLHTEGCD